MKIIVRYAYLNQTTVCYINTELNHRHSIVKFANDWLNVAVKYRE